MHIGETGHEVQSAVPLNPDRVDGHLHRGRADGGNPAALDHYGLMGNDSLAVHWNQVDIDKCNCPQRRRERRVDRARHLVPVWPLEPPGGSGRAA